MTTYFQFVPNPAAPFTFNPVLDGQTYVAAITWNLAGQRWYVSVTDPSGNLIFSLPLLGSPDGTRLESIDWAHGTVTAVTAAPHGYTAGQVVDLTISGCAPDAYNGAVQAFIVDGLTFTYSLAVDPGTASAIGAQIYSVNLAGGYFDSSSLVYRASTQTFEVTP